MKYLFYYWPKSVIIFEIFSEKLISRISFNCEFYGFSHFLSIYISSFRFHHIMEEVKTEQSEITTEEVAETDKKAETVAETAVETEAEETSVTTATNKEVDPNMSNYIRLRGLPFSAKEDDVRAFLKGKNLFKIGFGSKIS